MNRLDFELLLYDYFAPEFEESDDVVSDVLELFSENPVKFKVFIEGLMEMIDVGDSPLTGKRCKGFAINGMWLARTEIK